MKAAIRWLYNISYWWPVHTMISVRFWHRRLEDSSIAICWQGFRRATQKCAEFFTRRQWLNGRFSESGLSHDDGRTNKHGPYFARVLLKRCEGKEQCLI